MALEVLTYGSLVSEIVTGALATIDIGTDSFIVVQVLWFGDQDIQDVNYWFLAGALLFGVSVIFRFLTEFVFYSDPIYKVVPSFRKWLCYEEKPLDWCCGVMWWFFCFPLYSLITTPLAVCCLAGIFLLKIARVVLIPLDPVLAVGHRMSSKRTFYFPMVQASHCHAGLDGFYKRTPFPLRYIYLIYDLVAGGRFKVSYVVQHGKYLNRRESYIVNKKKRWGRNEFVILLASLEEVVENIGGIIMSVSVLMFNMDQPQLLSREFAIGSLVISAVSAVIETGKYIGDYRALNDTSRPPGRSTESKAGTTNDIEAHEKWRSNPFSWLSSQ